MHCLLTKTRFFYIRNYFDCNWKKLIFLGKGIEPKLTFCHVITPKRQHTLPFWTKTLFFVYPKLFWFVTEKIWFFSLGRKSRVPHLRTRHVRATWVPCTCHLRATYVPLTCHLRATYTCHVHVPRTCHLRAPQMHKLAWYFSFESSIFTAYLQ